MTSFSNSRSLCVSMECPVHPQVNSKDLIRLRDEIARLIVTLKLGIMNGDIEFPVIEKSIDALDDPNTGLIHTILHCMIEEAGNELARCLEYEKTQDELKTYDENEHFFMSH